MNNVMLQVKNLLVLTLVLLISAIFIPLTNAQSNSVEPQPPIASSQEFSEDTPMALGDEFFADGVVIEPLEFTTLCFEDNPEPCEDPCVGPIASIWESCVPIFVFPEIPPVDPLCLIDGCDPVLGIDLSIFEIPDFVFTPLESGVLGPLEAQYDPIPG